MLGGSFKEKSFAKDNIKKLSPPDLPLNNLGNNTSSQIAGIIVITVENILPIFHYCTFKSKFFLVFPYTRNLALGSHQAIPHII